MVYSSLRTTVHATVSATHPTMVGVVTRKSRTTPSTANTRDKTCAISKT
jgi:hypothetical protein